MSNAFHLFYFATGAIWFYRAVRACSALQRVPFLPPAPPRETRPWVSFVQIVRDASPDHAATFADLRAQRGVTAEILVVDDRAPSGATDFATAAEPASRVERIDAVPDDWLPRVHALARGTEHATGEWIVIVDQPLHLEPDAIARALEHARTTRADHLTVLPRGRSGVWEPLMTSAFVDSLTAIAAVNRDRDAMPIVSPLLLVGRTALERVGGFGALRMHAFTELALVGRLRAAGHHLRIVHAPDVVETRRAIRATQLVEVLERVFATIDIHVVVLAIALLLYAAVWVGALLGPLSENVWGLFAFAGLLSSIVPAWIVAQTYRGSYLAALLAPLTLPFELAFTAYAVARMHVRRGVVWQGRFYALDALREAAGQRDDTSR